MSLTMLAFLLRLYRLNVQSLWFDESLSALFASQPFKVSIQSMLEEGLHHSPLFYILLRPFAAGRFDEFVLRFLPATLGVCAVPLLAHVGRIVAGARVGILAAILLVINPFHVWYSQETRMYTLLIVCALGAMFFFMRNLHSVRLRNWLGIAIFTAIGINTHHFAFFIPLVQFTFLLLTLRQNHRLLRPWTAAMLLAGLSLIPWIWVVIKRGQFYGASAAVNPVSWYDFLQTFWNFSIGYSEHIAPFIIVALSLFFVLMLAGMKVAQKSEVGWLVLLWLLIPPAVTFLLSLRLPMYVDRYISLSLPPFLLLLVLGIESIVWDKPRLLMIGCSVTAMVVGLGRVYYDTSVYARADWRSVGAYLEQNAYAEDILLTTQWADLVPLHFYYHGGATVESLAAGDRVNLPASPVAETYPQVWLIIPYPNNSAHLVGHCQTLDANEVYRAELREWRLKYQSRKSAIKEFPCIRVETYRWAIHDDNTKPNG
jgi:mannosyltransferase